MKHILALTDFSSLAQEAVISAFELAKAQHADLTIYHSMANDNVLTIDIPNRGLEQQGQPIEEQMNQWIAMSKQHGVNVRYMTNGTSIEHQLNKMVQQYSFDLIVMASRGLNYKNNSGWGSVTKAVIKAVDSPVLVLKKKLQSPVFNKIVFASSFNIEDRDIVRHFFHLFDVPKDAEFHLLAIDTATFFTQPTIVMQGAMDQFISYFEPYRASTTFYRDQSVNKGIMHYLEEVEPDLLFMGNNKENKLVKAILGNKMLKTIQKTEIPFLSIDF